MAQIVDMIQAILQINSRCPIWKGNARIDSRKQWTSCSHKQRHITLRWSDKKYAIFRRLKKVGHTGGAFDSAKNHKRQRRKRQSVTAKREKSQTPKFV